jgi:hypothetical protein
MICDIQTHKQTYFISYDPPFSRGNKQMYVIKSVQLKSVLYFVVICSGKVTRQVRSTSL